MLIGAILTSGNWHLAGSLIYWLGLLFCAFAAGCVMLTATAPSTKEKSKPSLPPLFPPATYIPEVQPQGRMTIWIGLPAVAIFAATAGYAIRDHQLVKNTFTYEGVTVNSQVSDRRYWMTIPGYTRQRDFEFCHPLKMPADVIDIRFEQKYGCKQVYGVGFVQPHKEKTHELQNGRSSAAAPETTAGLEGRQAQARR